MEQRRLVAVRLTGLVAASRRFSASLSDRSRVRTMGIVAATNLVSWAGRRGPTSLILGWASPIRTRVKVRPSRWTGPVEINLTFSPLISPLYFKIIQLELNSLLFLYSFCSWSSSHCRLVRRACFIMTVITYCQTNSHNTPFCIETRP